MCEAVRRRGELWLRSPTGTITQASDAGRSQPQVQPSIVGMDPSGRTVYLVGPDLYLSAAGQPPILLASQVGTWWSRRYLYLENFASYTGGRWLFAIRGTLYTLVEQVPESLAIAVEGHGTVSIAPYGGELPDAMHATHGHRGDRHADRDRRPARLAVHRLGRYVSGSTPPGAARIDRDTSIVASFHAADTTPPVITGLRATTPAGSHLSPDIPAAIPLLVT